MSQTLLVIEYEPRTIARVTEALASLDVQVVSAKDVDTAVQACSKVEPRVVIITSVLPRVKVEDAITQLRARAGLKTTPFVILMSGYSGDDPAADAARLGAQDLVAKPFSNQELATRVGALIEAPRAQTVISPDTRAEVLQSLRGSGEDGGTMTAAEIFGDLLEEEAAEEAAAQTQRIPVDEIRSAQPAAPGTPVAGQTSVAESPAPVAPPPARAADSADKFVEATLADVLGPSAKKARVREDTGGASVDELLSQTLSGLEKRPTPKRTTPAPPVVSPESEPAKAEVLAEPAEAEGGPPGVAGEGKPFGQYELIELIATGGMAELFKARMQGVEGFQKIVAIKRILPHLTSNDEFVTMFVDEAKLAAQLQHPNIIHIYDLGKIERSYYIAMEYIDGQDLRSILRTLAEKKRRLPFGLALHIGARLAEALDYAHRKKDLQGKAMALVHRDVSPQNVLISHDGDIKLCDFGIAKAASKASHTRAGALKGKLQYMSPEQAWGKDLDGRSDIFSLGLVLYEMVTGEKAFAGDSELSILEQVRSPRLRPPREIDESIPAEAEEVLMKALREDREDRYQTAGELTEALEGLLQSMRPKPGSGEMGALLAELTGRVLGPAPTEAVAAPAQPTPTEPEPGGPEAVPAPPAERVPARAAARPGREVSAVTAAPAKKPPYGLIGLAAVVVLGVALWYVFLRAGVEGGPGEQQGAVDLQGAVQQEVDRQLGGEAVIPPTEESVPAAVALLPTAAPVVAPTSPPRPGPTQAPAAVVAPTPVPTAVPTQEPVLPTPEPTVAVPTPAPTAVPTRPPPTPTRAPIAPAQPTVREGDLVEPGPDVVLPEAISNPRPQYPPAARAQRVGGVVILELLIDHNGAVENVRVLRGVRSDIDAAAMEAARQWRFRPATKNGVRVKVRQTITIPFRP